MQKRLVLILEDDEARLARFKIAIHQIDPQWIIHVWPDAHVMIQEVDEHLACAALISLDHDLYPQDPHAPDPGDGLDVARHLAQSPPACPVLIHSTNVDRSKMMVGELTLAGWSCTRIPPLGQDWIEKDWTVVVRSLLNNP